MFPQATNRHFVGNGKLGPFRKLRGRLHQPSCADPLALVLVFLRYFCACWLVCFCVFCFACCFLFGGFLLLKQKAKCLQWPEVLPRPACKPGENKRLVPANKVQQPMQNVRGTLGDSLTQKQGPHSLSYVYLGTVIETLYVERPNLLLD